MLERKRKSLVQMTIFTVIEGLEMKMQEVREKAKALGMKKTFGLSKAELIRKIQKAEGNFDCFGTAGDYCDQVQCCFREDCLKPSVPKTN
jgi:hypothetical protein